MTIKICDLKREKKKPLAIEWVATKGIQVIYFQY